MNIKELRQRRQMIKNQIDQILAGVDPAVGLTDEDKKKIEELRAQRTSNDELIALCEEQMQEERNLPAVQKISVGKDNVEDDPKGGFKNHKEFLNAVMQSGYTGVEDSRLKRFRAAQGSDEHQVGSDPYGGYLVPAGVAPGVLTISPEDDPVAGLVRSIPMNSPTVAFNARVDKNHSTSVSGGLTVTRKPETVDASSSRMKFEQVRLTAHDLFGLTFATENVLTDSPESFIALLTAGFGDEFGSHIMEERLNGDGSGMFLGILDAANGALVVVAKEQNQAADTILKENIDKMISRCWRYSRAVWHANHTTRPQLSGLYQLVGTTGGQPVEYFKPGAGPNGEDLLVGRPIYFTEHCAALGDQGDLTLAQWGEFLEGTYQRMRQDESIHVRFLSAERAFRFFLRNDGKPWWTAPLTPKKGLTLSPFVTLAAR
jgi:HK97 family phage major capsid protein